MIYFVDDEKNSVDTFTLIVPGDWNLKTFTDPVQALKSMSTDKPIILISDIMMPSIDGINFIDIAKTILKDSAIVYISANTESQIQAEFGKMSERSFFFRKPLGESFFEKIEELIQASKKTPSEVNDKNTVDQQVEYLKRFEEKYKEYFDFFLRTITEYHEITHEGWGPKALNEYNEYFMKFKSFSEILGLSKEQEKEIMHGFEVKFGDPRVVLLKDPKPFLDKISKEYGHIEYNKTYVFSSPMITRKSYLIDLIGSNEVKSFCIEPHSLIVNGSYSLLGDGHKTHPDTNDPTFRLAQVYKWLSYILNRAKYEYNLTFKEK